MILGFFRLLVSEISTSFPYDHVSAGDGGKLPAETGIYLKIKKKKMSQGGKHNFPKSLGVEDVHPKLLEEFQEAAELHSHVTF